MIIVFGMLFGIGWGIGYGLQIRFDLFRIDGGILVYLLGFMFVRVVIIVVIGGLFGFNNGVEGNLVCVYFNLVGFLVLLCVRLMVNLYCFLVNDQYILISLFYIINISGIFDYFFFMNFGMVGVFKKILVELYKSVGFIFVMFLLIDDIWCLEDVLLIIGYGDSYFCG